MGKTTWKHLVVAAILILIAGAVLVSAGEEQIKVLIEKAGDNEVSIDVNGVTEVVRLDDLADGESRTFGVGDHEVEVKRVGEKLSVFTEGHAIASIGDHGMSKDVMVWVGDEGENVEIRKEKVIVIKTDGDGDAMEHAYTYHISGDDELLDGEIDIEIEEILEKHGVEGHEMIFFNDEGDSPRPMIIKSHHCDGMVKYRCEETGATLTVKKEDAVDDSYICPVTGCLMERVEEPEMKVIKIQVEAGDED